MREIVREEAARGATVFFSSHILGQVEAVCDRVGILQEGSLVAEDTVEGLRAADGSEAVLTVEVAHVPEGALSAVRGLPGVSDVTASDTTVTVQCGDGAKLPALNELDASASVQDFDLTKTSLEDLFLAHMEDATPPADTGAAPPPTSRDHSSEVANQ